MKQVAVAASGPSLNRQDLELLLQKGVPILAVNDTWRLVPECFALFAGDEIWWRHHWQKAKVQLPRSQFWTSSRKAANRFGLRLFDARERSYNSGQQAVRLALEMGFERVLLLGFDCSLRDGLHWHGAHQETHNPTERSIEAWHAHFESISEPQKQKIINCSRATALECFERGALEDFLGD